MSMSDYAGLWGTWGSAAFCDGEDNPVIGFDVREVGYLGFWHDDLSITDVDLYCRRGQNGLNFNRPSYISAGVPSGLPGSWRPRQLCRQGYAVTGLRTQNQKFQGGIFTGYPDDDTAMNGIELYCEKFDGKCLLIIFWGRFFFLYKGTLIHIPGILILYFS